MAGAFTLPPVPFGMPRPPGVFPGQVSQPAGVDPRMVPMQYRSGVPSYFYVANFYPMVDQQLIPMNFRGDIVYYDPRTGMVHRRHDINN